MATKVHLFLARPDSAAQLREKYPYGPSPNGFHPDLAIEVDPAQVGKLGKSEAVAVVSGMARLILDPLSPQTCALVLMPLPKDMDDLSQVVGRSVVVFVYRNLQLVTPPDIISEETLFPVRPLEDYNTAAIKLNMPAQDVSEQLSKFLKGEIALAAKAGKTMGFPSIIGGTNNWGRLGFEVVFVPSGLRKESGWDRLKDLIKPGAKTRRLDPASFYARVQAGTSKVSLATDDAGHPLLTKLTRRTLLELRNEYDKPFTNTAYVYDGVQTTPLPFDDDSWGTVPLPATTTFSSVEVPDHVSTELPSGDKGEVPAVRNFTAPDHWSLQLMYMSQNPAVADEHMSWFAPNASPLDATNGSLLPRYTENNKITYIQDGIDVFKKYAAAISSLSSGDYLYIAGWVMMDDFNLIYEHSNSPNYPTHSMHNLLKGAAQHGAKIRALLWAQSSVPPAVLQGKVTEAVAHVNGLPNNAGIAFADEDTNVFGSHHQKIFIVSASVGYAFCGGVDINRDRLDSPNHGAPGAFHDVHAKVEGPAVADIHHSFTNRWNRHAGLKPISNNPTDLVNYEPPPKFEADAGSVYVQVACTYSSGMAYAPKGSTAPLDAFIRAIGKAQKFIYVEDQYFTAYPDTAPTFTDPDGHIVGDAVGVVTAFRDALKKDDPPYVIILIPNYADLGWTTWAIGKGQGRYRRQQFIRALREFDPGIRQGLEATRVHAFYLRRTPSRFRLDEVATDGGCDDCSGGANHRSEIYCHSKVWIVDDVIAKIGSANCNRRSYTHDSEMDIVMVDGSVSSGARTFARKLRMALWGEHLGVTPSSLEDYKLAIEYWLRTPQPRKSRVVPYEHDLDIENNNHSGWDTIIDPDGRL